MIRKAKFHSKNFDEAWAVNPLLNFEIFQPAFIEDVHCLKGNMIIVRTVAAQIPGK